MALRPSASLRPPRRGKQVAHGGVAPPSPRRARRPRRARASHDPAASQSKSGRAPEDRGRRGRSRPRARGAESGGGRTSRAACPGGSDPGARGREPRQRDGDARARAGLGLAPPRRRRRAAPGRPAHAPTANPWHRAASLPRPIEGLGDGACPDRRAARRPGRPAHIPGQALHLYGTDHPYRSNCHHWGHHCVRCNRGNDHRAFRACVYPLDGLRQDGVPVLGLAQGFPQFRLEEGCCRSHNECDEPFADHLSDQVER